MGDLLRFETAGGPVLVEERSGSDLERAGVFDRIRPAAHRLETAFAQVRPAAEAAMDVVRGLRITPGQVELELGVTLTAEAGAVISRTALEGHIILRISWAPQREPSAADR